MHSLCSLIGCQTNRSHHVLTDVEIKIANLKALRRQDIFAAYQLQLLRIYKAIFFRYIHYCTLISNRSYSHVAVNLHKGLLIMIQPGNPSSANGHKSRPSRLCLRNAIVQRTIR
jgi:hypothetical protein